MKLQPAAWLKKGPGHPARGKTQQAPTLVQRTLDKQPKIGINSVEGGNGLKHKAFLTKLESEALL